MYEYNNNMTIKTEAFNQAVYDYCYAENDFRTYAVQYSKMRRTPEWWGSTSEYRKGVEAEYWKKSALSDAAWNTLRLLSDLVGLDPVAVLAVFKAIRRNSQYQNNWEREAHFSNNRYFEFEGKRPGSVESFCNLCRKS